MARYPEHLNQALVIDNNWSYCGACGKGAFPEQKEHTDIAGWNPVRGGGCGITWINVTSAYYDGRGQSAIKEVCLDMRPDLEWIDFFITKEKHAR